MRIRLRQNNPIQPVASDCSRIAAVGQLLAAVDDGDVVEAEEAAFEDVDALAVDLVHPPREVDQQLVKALLEELAVGAARCAPSRGCRRASTAQACTGGLRSENSHSYAGICPLGCWNCSNSSTQSCSLANSGIDQRERDAVERQIPGREPRILPLVRHREDAHRVQMPPVRVADAVAATRAAAWSGCRPRASGSRRRGRSASSTACPASACRCTSRSSSLAFGGWIGVVELVGLALPRS